MSDDDFMGGGGRSVPFDNVGDTVTGIVLSPPKKQEQVDDEGNVRTFPNGAPRYVYLVEIQTDLRDPDDPSDMGVRTLWLKWKSHEAVVAAIRQAGARNLEVGGILTLTLAGFGPKSKASWNPPKLYSATYVPPTANPTFMDDGSSGSASVPTSPAPQPSAPAGTTAAQKSVLDRLREQAQYQSQHAQAMRTGGPLPPNPAHHAQGEPPF